MGSTSGQVETFRLFHRNGTETDLPIQASCMVKRINSPPWTTGESLFNESSAIQIAIIVLSSGECVYLDFEGKWKGADCGKTEVRKDGLYALCKRPGKPEEGTTQNPQETTGGVGIFTHGKKYPIGLPLNFFFDF